VEKGNYLNAIENLKIDISNSYNNPDNKIIKMVTLSKCYTQQKAFNDAKAYLDSASLLFEGKMSKSLKLELLLNYATMSIRIHYTIEFKKTNPFFCSFS
jgi:hypothetical protein